MAFGVSRHACSRCWQIGLRFSRCRLDGRSVGRGIHPPGSRGPFGRSGLWASRLLLFCLDQTRGAWRTHLRRREAIRTPHLPPEARIQPLRSVSPLSGLDLESERGFSQQWERERLPRRAGICGLGGSRVVLLGPFSTIEGGPSSLGGLEWNVAAAQQASKTPPCWDSSTGFGRGRCERPVVGDAGDTRQDVSFSRPVIGPRRLRPIWSPSSSLALRTRRRPTAEAAIVTEKTCPTSAGWQMAQFNGSFPSAVPTKGRQSGQTLPGRPLAGGVPTARPIDPADSGCRAKVSPSGSPRQ